MRDDGRVTFLIDQMFGTFESLKFLVFVPAQGHQKLFFKLLQRKHLDKATFISMLEVPHYMMLKQKISKPPDRFGNAACRVKLFLELHFELVNMCMYILNFRNFKHCRKFSQCKTPFF